MVTYYDKFGNSVFGFVAKSAFHRKLTGIKEREGVLFKGNFRLNK